MAEKDIDLGDILLSVGRSATIANKAFHAFCELDFSAIHQQYADALGKSVDGLTDDEKRQAIMGAVLNNG